MSPAAAAKRGSRVKFCTPSLGCCGFRGFITHKQNILNKFSSLRLLNCEDLKNHSLDANKGPIGGSKGQCFLVGP